MAIGDKIKEKGAKIAGTAVAGPLGGKLAGAAVKAQKRQEERIAKRVEETVGKKLSEDQAKRLKEQGTKTASKTVVAEWDLKKLGWIVGIIFAIIATWWVSEKLAISRITGIITLIIIAFFTFVFKFYPKARNQIIGLLLITTGAYAGYYFSIKAGLSTELYGAIAIIVFFLYGLYHFFPEIGGPLIEKVGVVVGVLLSVFGLGFLGLPSFFIVLWIIMCILGVWMHYKLLKGSVVVLIIVMLIIWVNMSFPAWVPEGSPAYRAFSGTSEAWLKVGEVIGVGFTEGIPRIASDVGTQFRRQFLYATGNYEAGVEESAEKPLGVFLEKQQMIPPKVPLDGKVTSIVHLRAAANTDLKKPLELKVECKGGNKKGEIKPVSQFTITSLEEMDLTCGFNAVDIGKGTTPVKFLATFDFTTGAYLRSYFMRQETIRDYLIQQKDPLDDFQITDKKPLAKFSAGPVRIGMGVPSSPIPIIKDVKYGPLLKVTLEKNWYQGKIVKLKQMRITMPPGLTIDAINSEPLGIFEAITGTVDALSTSDLTPAQSSREGVICRREVPEGSNDVQPELTCTLHELFLNRIFPEGVDIDTMVVQTAFESPEAVMTLASPGGQTQTAPLVVRNFKVEVDYRYEIETKKDVTITTAEALRRAALRQRGEIPTTSTETVEQEEQQ